MTPCPNCGGDGRYIEKTCGTCGGEGLERRERVLEVEVPPGVSTGDYITLRGQGHSGARGGPKGDVIVVIEVEEDPRFVREGANLIHELPITYTQAVLGGEVEVPTVGGTARLKIPAGTQSGRLLRLRERGLPHLHGGGRGDMIVRVVVWVPTSLKPEEEALLRELARVESRPPKAAKREEDRSFWSKVREAITG